MQKQQKRSRAEATFAFGETELSYAFRYGASVHKTVADYFEITPARKFIAQHDWSAFRFGALVSLLGLTAMAAQTFISATPDRKSTRLNSSHVVTSRMPSSA